MALRCRHNQLRGLVDGIARPIPVDNHAIDAAAHHVINLTLDLRRVRLTVTNVHVVRLTEPKNHVSINLGRGPGIKQGMNVNLTYVPRAPIVIRLRRKAIRRTGVIGRLSCESGCGYHIRGASRT